MKRYTLQERIELIEIHYKSGENLAETVRKTRIFLGCREAQMPVHFGVEGNEMADDLAKSASRIIPGGHEPFCGLCEDQFEGSGPAMRVEYHNDPLEKQPSLTQSKILVMTSAESS